MSKDRLSHLPSAIATRIIERLDLTSRLALARTCKSLRDATQEAGQAELVRHSLRPGRISTDPFPTLYEHVQRGARPHYRAIHASNLLHACRALPPGDGLLQAAAKRRLRAMVHIERGAPIQWENQTYYGERDASGRPHGVGLCWCNDIYEYRSVYMGDWRNGQRSGWGTQFFWIEPPELWSMNDEDATDLLLATSHRGGWYEGQWDQDKYSGVGLLTRPNLMHREGLWKDGEPIG